MSITSQVWNYIRRHPNISVCVRHGLINYSALARIICRDEGIPNFEGVLSACRRYGSHTTGGKDTERSILSILRKGHLVVTTHMGVVIAEKPREFEALDLVRAEARKMKGELNFIEGREVITLFCSERLIPAIRKALGRKILRTIPDLVQISLLLDDRLETTPGVVAHIYSLLAFEGINIREEASCGTEILILVDKGDMQRASDLLSVFWES